MTSYQILTPASLRSWYVTLTDKLIFELERHPRADGLHLLFLDKSARPVAWLVRAFWPLFARRPGTSYGEAAVPPLPKMTFANIDREQWWHLTGASETSVVDIELIPRPMVAQLRAAYLRHEPAADVDPWTEPAFLDGAAVVVVDEVAATGDTLRIAAGLVSRAFPSASVSSAHWMTPGTAREARSGQNQILANPVWYRRDTWHGRLVGNREAPVHRSRHWRSRVGPLFLSTVPPEPDLRGIQLRDEVAALAADVAAGVLLAMPAPTRDPDDLEDRIRSIFGYSDLAAFTRDRAAQDRAL